MAINFTTLATSALGFTIALAWNDAVSKTVGSFFPPRDERSAASAARATLVYALVITILVIAFVAVINRTRKLVHRFGAGAGAGEESHSRGREVMRARGDAGAESGRSLAPVIRLWEPPGGAT